MDRPDRGGSLVRIARGPCGVRDRKLPVERTDDLESDELDTGSTCCSNNWDGDRRGRPGIDRRVPRPTSRFPQMELRIPGAARAPPPPRDGSDALRGEPRKDRNMR